MDYLQKANIWKNYQKLDKELATELKKMTDDELKEAFTADLEFGTGGLRGILGVGTNRMNIYIVNKATLGFGQYLSQFENAFERGVVISHDNRHKSKEFSLESAKVLASLGFNVYLFEDLRPTPELSFAVRHLQAIGGIMITASHNPKEYNGYKIYDETGCQLVPEMADLVIEKINAITDFFNIERGLNNEKIKYIGSDIDEVYISEVKKITLRSYLPKDFKVVYSPLHGTGQVFATEVLKQSGYSIVPLASQMTNDPDFSGVKCSNPENAEAYDEAIELAKEINALAVVVTDPDADRLGVAVLHNGEYELINGNQTGTLLLHYILMTREQTGLLPKNGHVFTTNVSSTLPVKIAEHYGMNVGITLTGFKYIGQKALELEGTDGKFVFGFEESYGCLIKDCVRDKDAIQAFLMICEVIAYYKTKGMTLIDALNSIYEEYGYYLEDITNITLSGLAGKERINVILEYFRKGDFTLPSFSQIITEDCQKSMAYNHKTGELTKIMLPKSNMIKYLLNDDMWFVLRPSGTEPKLKIYYGVTGKNKAEALNNLELLKKEVMEVFEKID